MLIYGNHMINITAMKTVGADFVFGYIQAIDGEKVHSVWCVHV